MSATPDHYEKRWGGHPEIGNPLNKSTEEWKSPPKFCKSNILNLLGTASAVITNLWVYLPLGGSPQATMQRKGEQDDLQEADSQ